MGQTKFWMCFVEGNRSPERCHLTADVAQEEAIRLARIPENCGKRVYILEAINFCRVDPIPVIFEQTSM